MIFNADNSAISYMGRVDFSDKKAPKFFYPGTQASFVTDGTFVKATLNVKNFWGELTVGVIIDGKPFRIAVTDEINGKDTVYTIAENLEKGKHEVVIYKAHAANQLLTLKSIETDGQLLSADKKYSLKLDVYGDSVCAGEVIEAGDYVGKCDPENHNSRYDNVYYSFVMQTARKLGAEINNNSQGGIALFDGTGYFHMPNCIGLESTYNKMCYFPEGGELSDWDFARYTPDFVIIAIGQNDKHNAEKNTDDIDISDVDYRRKWKEKYKELVRDLNNSYKTAVFILTTTVLMHDKDWDKAIEEICEELCGEGICCRKNTFSRNGTATPGHPRIIEHNEMANELTEFIGYCVAADSRGTGK